MPSGTISTQKESLRLRWCTVQELFKKLLTNFSLEDHYKLVKNMDDIPKSNAFAAAGCGVVIILCGFGDLVIGILWHVRLAEIGAGYGAYYGSGFYSGIPLFIAGALGAALFLKRSRGLMGAFLAFCIIACILATVQALITGLISTILATTFNSFDCLGTKSHNCSDLGIFIIQCMLAWAVFSSVGAVLTFVGSIIGCVSTCCASTPQTAANPGVVIVNPQPAVPMQTYTGPADPSLNAKF